MRSRTRNCPKRIDSRLGIVIASGYGAAGMTYAFLKSFINDGDICASPTCFSSSVHNSAAAHISIQLGAKGPNLTVSDVHLPVPSALATARIWLAEERVQRVLFGAIDELSELIGYIRYRTRDASPTAPMTPLRTEVESSIPGEGAAFLLLARENASRGGYCTLDASTTGSLPIPGFPFPEHGLLVLGADGMPGDRAGDTRRWRKTPASRATPPCTGPCRPGRPSTWRRPRSFSGRDEVFPSPGGAFRDFPATVPGGGEPVGAGRIFCLTLAGDEAYGLTTLGRVDSQ